MSAEIWATYVITVLILMSTPGPSQLLMLSNSLSHGFSRSVYTAAGDLSANFFQMLIASVGLVGLIASSQGFFTGVKWIGVVYLVYLGLKQLFSKVSMVIGAKRESRSIRSLYWQGFITSAANPKAVIFFAALFPQFINPEENLWLQFVVLSSTYLIIDGVFLCGYGKFADWISIKALPTFKNYLNKLSGVFLIVAAVLLGVKETE